MPAALLSHRTMIRLTGEKASSFLQGLVTCNMDHVVETKAAFGALLSPQGKILFDFLIIKVLDSDGGGFAFDIARVHADNFVERLNFYKLRTRIDLWQAEDIGVIAGWGDAPKPDPNQALVFDDPRSPELGWRAFLAKENIQDRGEESFPLYEAHRIGLTIPEGGRDFLFGEAFPHEALMDSLKGVDFKKGCYVGQEVVSRMEHRSTARTRIIQVIYEDGYGPEQGMDVFGGERLLGKTGTSIGAYGLMMVRIDRMREAMEAGLPLQAGGTVFSPVLLP